MATAISESRERRQRRDDDQPHRAPPLDTPAELARAALDDADSDLEAATDALTAKLLASPELIKTHLRKIVSEWARQQIMAVLKGRRQHIIEVARTGSFQEGLQTAMRNELTRLMDIPIFGGKRLGDATPEEVRESAARYNALAKDTARKAHWQQLVADTAEKNGGASSPIASTLSEATLNKLWEEADAAE